MAAKVNVAITPRVDLCAHKTTLQFYLGHQPYLFNPLHWIFCKVISARGNSIMGGVYKV
jgi:hypothetical protein